MYNFKAGETYGYLTIIDKVPNTNGKKLLCKCKCGNDVVKWRDSIIATLKKGGIPSCGCYKNKPNNLQYKTINNWTILEDLGNDKVRARCKCGNIRVLSKYNITSGHSKSCGCLERPLKQDVTGQKINNWTVISDNRDSTLTCKCICGTIKRVDKYSVVHGLSKSCGCLRGTNSSNTMYELYNEVGASRILNPREQWQLDILRCKENFRKYIEGIEVDNKKVTVSQLCALLDTSQRQILNYIHNYNCEDLVQLSHNYSVKEGELGKLVADNTNRKVILNDRNVLNSMELDVYIPELKLAFEFNGNYWHSSIYKDKKYHQYKTLACAKQGIRLIHVFQYEWNNNRDRVERFIKGLLNENKRVIQARETVVKEIDSKTAQEFCEYYHLQGWSNSKVCIGCYYNDELVSVMTFAKPRFDNNIEYEIIRYCVKDNVSIVGGANKLFKYFTDTYKPASVITYSDISKFTGNIYLKLGFKVDSITSPNYVWVKSDTQEVITRYQTQKHKLVEKGLGTENQTEEEIMYDLGFFKVYDSGNIKLIWNKEA